MKMKREDFPLWKQLRTAAGQADEHPDRVAWSGRRRAPGLHLPLTIDGESRGLSQAANWEAWNKRRAAESSKLFITAATAVFLSKYVLYVLRKTVSCLHEDEQVLLRLHTDEHMGQIKPPHGRFLSEILSASSNFKGDEMTLKDNNICLRLIFNMYSLIQLIN